MFLKFFFSTNKQQQQKQAESIHDGDLMGKGYQRTFSSHGQEFLILTSLGKEVFHTA